MILILVKWILILAFALACYLVNMFFLQPYLIRKKYGKYANVGQSEDMQYIQGDLVDTNKNQVADKYLYWHYVEQWMKDTQPDIYIKFLGHRPMFLFFSIQALEEMRQLQPLKIDRDDYFIDQFIGKIFPGSFAQKLSDDNWKERRNTSMRTLGINFASRYISTLVEIIDKTVKTWEKGQEMDFTAVFSSIQFTFTCKMLFGKEFELSFRVLKYKNYKGEYEDVDMQTMMQNLAMDTYMGLYDSIGKIFPFLNKYNLVEPYKRTQENIKEFRNTLIEFLASSKDEECYYAQIKNTGKFTEDEMVSDLLLMLFAGSDTTSHATASILYFLKKFPDEAEKCLSEYKKVGIITSNGLERDMLKMQKFEECEYSEYFIKEMFRLDHTAPETVSYQTLQDVVICGVPIDKGNICSISLTGMHYDKREYYKPLEFMPERFDPESEYFTSPKTGKSRSPLSFIPFSTGIRNCPGQTMARLIQRVTMPYFMSVIDYEVDKDLLNNDKALFNNTSQYHLKIKITEINI